MAKKVDYQLERLYEALVNQSLNSLDEGVMDMLRKGGAKVAKFFKGSKKPKAPKEPPRKKSLGELAAERTESAGRKRRAAASFRARDLDYFPDPSVGAESDELEKGAKHDERVAGYLKGAEERSRARKQGK
jgi:hypothetical protein